ncbi:MAG: molybdenum cofactor guanylyltransferase [Acidobacteriota bacterium]
MSGNRLGFVHGYVLAGGQSSRMGRDKAMLELDGATMLRRTYDLLAEVCGAATVVGPKERYASLGLPLIEDARHGCGPLAGIEAALQDCSTKVGADWALIVACDMPGLDEQGLAVLLDEAPRAGAAQVLLPVSEGGRRQPLCALYRPQALGVVRKQLETGQFKLLNAIAQLPMQELALNRPHHFLNVNRPEDWEALHVRG